METLTGSKQKRLTLVLVHTFENNRLRRRQNMFTYAISTHFVSVQQQCMLLSVTEQTEVGTVESFVWDYDYLKKYQEHQAFWIDQVTGDGQEMIVVQGQNRLVAYTQPPLEKAYPIEMSSFKMNESAMVLMKSNGRQFLLALRQINEEEQTDLEVNCMELRMESTIVSSTFQFNFYTALFYDLLPLTLDDVGSETFLPDKCYLDLQSAIQTRQSHVDRLNSEVYSNKAYVHILPISQSIYFRLKESCEKIKELNLMVRLEQQLMRLLIMGISADSISILKFRSRL